jgi:hypothetical protein
VSIFTLVRDVAMQNVANVVKNAGTMGDTKDKVQSFVGKVTGSWIGGDEQAFEQEIMTRVIPMTAEFIASLMNVSINTQSAIDIMDQADGAAKGIGDQIKDAFSAI